MLSCRCDFNHFQELVREKQIFYSVLQSHADEKQVLQCDSFKSPQSKSLLKLDEERGEHCIYNSFFGLATDECSEVSNNTSEIEILNEKVKKKHY